ncbi:MAG TPA: nuclear transport factor 2 family protein [Eudoraea sp.]|nr:nuclear transport factor 2 family protein [Eudoraea sp.]
MAFLSCQSDKENVVNSNVEIKKTMREYRIAWLEGDSSVVLNKISPDIILFRPNENGKPIYGKKEVSNFWFPQSEISYPILKYEIENEEIIVANKIAYYQGLSKLTWCTIENGISKDTTLSISEFTNILRNENGKWKIFRIMYNLKDENYSRE